MNDDHLPAPITVTLPGPTWTRLNAICLDSATSMASLALIQEGAVVAEQTWQTSMAHTRQLASRLRALAAEVGFALSSAGMICVCTGPGSFNGIRTGMATALGLAYGLSVPVYGVPSLDLLAFPHAEQAPAQRALLPAGRGEYYSALFSTRGGRWRRISPYTIGQLETIVQDSPARCLWCGAVDEADTARLADLLGGTRRLVPAPHNLRRAAYMLPLALAGAAAGHTGAPEALQPMYLRRPAITTPRVAVQAGA
jgi:tRNA threonylcarbamoyladenosine biosynthesis protein TsaB